MIDLIDENDIYDMIRGGKIYNTFVMIDGQNKFWVVVKNGRFIRNPTEKDLERAKIKSYSSTNICPICMDKWKRGDISELTDDSILYSGNARHKTDVRGIKTEEWVCTKHGDAYYGKYNPNSRDNIKKSLADRRIGHLKDPGNIFAEDCQELTCELFGVDDLNKKLDSYNAPYDHSRILKGMSIEIGGKSIDLSKKTTDKRSTF